MQSESAMPTFELDFEVYCQECGGPLCNLTEIGTTPKRGMPYIRVSPCTNCIEKADNEGYNRGYDEGKAEGERDSSAYNEGYADGLKEGRAEALEQTQA